MERIRAIIYVPRDAETATWEKICLDYCDRQGYQVVSIVRGSGAAQWREVLAMLSTRGDGIADVVVAARQNHIPPDRLPRIETVD